MPRHRWSAALLALLLTLLPAGALAHPPAQERSPNPDTVTIPGTIQSALGCPADWQPACQSTYLIYDEQFDLWSARFDLPAGNYEYKVALNDSWSENYGLGGVANGPNIPLAVATPGPVIFVYDHKTKWVADSINKVIAVAVGDFQSELGCPADNDAACFGSLMQDPDGDNIYSFITTAIPAGDYTFGVATGELIENFLGAGGQLGGEPISFTVQSDGDEIYFGFNVDTQEVIISTEGVPRGDLGKARAFWIARDTIAWRVDASLENSYSLHFAPAGGLSIEPDGVTGGERIALKLDPVGLGDALASFPHLRGLWAFKIAEADLARVPEILRGQVAIAAADKDGKPIDATGLQIPGALDDLYPYDGPLGVSWAGETPTVRLWAPTARGVSLLRFEDGAAAEPTERLPMTFDEAAGVWSIEGEPGWKGQYYLFEVEVYVPAEGAVVTNLVTDPYSLSLSTNSARSQLVDLDDPGLTPDGWADLAKPPLEAPEDIVLYELHVRDFSIFDETVPAGLRGTFAAFGLPDSAGMTHLRELAEAGVTHVHLLPAFDIATIEEDAARRTELPLAELAALPPDSPEQQEILAPIRDQDGFNWGYDPLHYTVPEGSYSTEPEGPQRIVEFREMVQSLNQAGLRVVMDVVYNHTNASGQSARSVLDRIVPGYYHRLDGDGNVTNSTCCANTATEHAMMEKLMVDSLVTWARAYKVDGFRFDLMGHHMKRNMLAVREALDALTLERDGVDGKAIYVYGEGWNFGEVANNARGENATQLNMAGTGIGTFSDRLRDAARGGGPFDGLQEQGFITGLFTDPNEVEERGPDEQRDLLLRHSDLIKVGLAGNLRDFTLVNSVGDEVPGNEVDYRGAPGGYTRDPQEQIVYVSAHDNETLFDAVQLKAPAGASVAERARMARLGLSLTALAQGIPFFHAGDELLRSKSLDRNSYNSSDWFNRVDWTGQTSNFGVGLPPAGDNEASWPVMQPLLADPALRPDAALIRGTYDHFREMLQIRRSTPLFRLRDAEQVQRMVSFLNSGPDQIPGLIVMSISDNGTDRVDPAIGQVVVVFNGRPEEASFSDPAFQGAELGLHEVLAASADERAPLSRFDPAGGSFTVPGRTTAVFVGPAPLFAAQGQEPTATAAPTATSAPTATAAPTAAPTSAPPPTPQPTAAPDPMSNGAAAAGPALAIGGLILALMLGAGLLLGRRRE